MSKKKPVDKKSHPKELNMPIYDPACGSGAFLSVADQMIKQQ